MTTFHHAGHTPGDFPILADFTLRRPNKATWRTLTCCLKSKTSFRSQCGPLNHNTELAICNSRCETCCCTNDSSETRSSRCSGSGCRVPREKNKRSWLGDGTAVLRNVHPLKSHFSRQGPRLLFLTRCCCRRHQSLQSREGSPDGPSSCYFFPHQDELSQSYHQLTFFDCNKAMIKQKCTFNDWDSEDVYFHFWPPIKMRWKWKCKARHQIRYRFDCEKKCRVRKWQEEIKKLRRKCTWIIKCSPA